jgi:hypothetical protein
MMRTNIIVVGRQLKLRYISNKSAMAMKKLIKIFLMLTISMQTLQPAHAALPRTDSSRIVEIEKIAAKARALLFHLSYVVQPVCAQNPGDLGWSLGPRPKTIPNKPVENSQKFQADAEAMVEQLKLEPGDSVFLADIEKTPWGYAGFRTNEAFKFDWKDTKPLSQMLAGYPGIDADHLDADKGEIKQNLQTEFLISRKGEAVKIRVAKVPVCLLGLDIVDSKYSYADSQGVSIIVTAPFLSQLSRDELVVVLSHEVAHSILKLNGRSTGKFVAKLILGNIVNIGENIETGMHEPKDTDLVKADKLALRLAAGFGVNVPSYVDIIHKLTKDQSLLGLPTYRLTRGIPPKREDQLRRSLALWNTEKKYYAVEGVEQQILLEIAQRARIVNTDPERVFGSPSVKQPAIVMATKNSAIQTDLTLESSPSTATRTVAWIPNVELRSKHPPTDFANLNDISAVPGISVACRERYQTWLAWANPKAYVVGPKGNCGFSTGTHPPNKELPIDPVERALLVCAKASAADCKLYAIDDMVVWKP